jgi:CheY-like chemotaxis protein
MPGTSKTVLLIEDSPAQALMLKFQLEEEGLRVLWARNGRAGVDMALQWLPDAIVLDVEMPGMNGFEACKRIKADVQTCSIPVVMLTVHVEPEVVRELLSQGAVDFIPKDVFSFTVLLETLRQLHVLDSISTAGGVPG